VRRQDHAREVAAVITVNALIMVLLWVSHGGLDAIDTGAGRLLAAGQLSALLGTYAALIELLLMSRIGWLERVVGFDRLAVWHRWNGFAAVWLLVAHTVLTTLGFASASHRTVVAQVGDFVMHVPDVLMAFVGLALFIAVGVTSARAARRRMSREAWYALHLYAYLAIVLTFAHQFAVGSDFVNDRPAQVWWATLYVAVFAAILVWRVGQPLAFNARHRLRVETVRPEADGVVSVYLSGQHLDEIRAEPGQFFLWRFLRGTGWAKAHPYSLSAAPNRRYLRITVKDLGDDSRKLRRVRPGTRVFAEGPYGTFTPARRTRRRVALIAGGIGITPLRAMLDALPGAPGDVTLLYRAASEGDIAFRGELSALAAKRGVDVRLLVGPEIGDDRTDRLGLPALRHHIPDVAQRDVYVCGPPAMVDVVRRRLTRLGVPPSQVHFERFAY
jgi:predicted ferric reductase